MGKPPVLGSNGWIVVVGSRQRDAEKLLENKDFGKIDEFLCFENLGNVVETGSFWGFKGTFDRTSLCFMGYSMGHFLRYHWDRFSTPLGIQQE